MSADLWQRGCERLAAELPEQQFNTWIRPLPPADVTEQGSDMVVGLRVPNRFKLDWIRAQYGRRIETTLSELAGRPVRLELAIVPRDLAPSRPALNVVQSGAVSVHAAAIHAQASSTNPAPNAVSTPQSAHT
jgi:chromosomal replication initiator protein